MRLVLKLEPESGRITLPVHYNHLVQGMIYQSLDEALAQWFHEQGFAYHKRRFKLFTFSRLLSRKPRYDHERRTLTFTGPIYLKIAAMDTEFLESLAIHLVRHREVHLNGHLCYFTAIEVEMPPEPRRPIRVRTLSPISVYRTLYDAEGKPATYFYHPQDPEFSQLLLDNLKRKAAAWFKERVKDLPPLDDAAIRTLRVGRMAVTEFKGTWIKGWDGVFELDLPGPYFTLAYNAGLGAKNSEGFGMVEVLRRRKHGQNTEPHG